MEGGHAAASPFPQRQRVARQLFVGRSKARLCLSIETLILRDSYVSWLQIFDCGWDVGTLWAAGAESVVAPRSRAMLPAGLG